MERRFPTAVYSNYSSMGQKITKETKIRALTRSRLAWLREIQPFGSLALTATFDLRFADHILQYSLRAGRCARQFRRLRYKHY
jgi:hypothetical protein